MAVCLMVLVTYDWFLPLNFRQRLTFFLREIKKKLYIAWNSAKNKRKVTSFLRSHVRYI